MKRRSFLGLLLAAPIAAPIVAKAASEMAPPSSSFTVAVDKFEVGGPTPAAAYAVRLNDQGRIIDIALRGDMICDGSITATPMTPCRITANHGTI